MSDGNSHIRSQSEQKYYTQQYMAASQGGRLSTDNMENRLDENGAKTSEGILIYIHCVKSLYYVWSEYMR